MAEVNEVRNALMASRSAILTTHLNADGDGAGSQVALASWLRSNGTDAWIINPTTFPRGLAFLQNGEDWAVPAGSGRARSLCEQADLAVILDTGEVPRIGRVNEMIRSLPTVVIDHHPLGDHPIGGISLRDPTACATGELVYDIISSADGPWNDTIAQGIYVALLTDTGSFRFENTSEACHQIAAETLRMGVEPEAMYDEIYGSSPLRKWQLLRFALESLEHDADFGVTWMTIPRDRYEELGLKAEDLEGAVDIPRSIEGTEVGVLFRSTKEGDVKMSFRSNGSVDVNLLARRFNGGGHVKASGALMPGPMDEAVEKVLAAAREAVSETRKVAAR